MKTSSFTCSQMSIHSSRSVHSQFFFVFGKFVPECTSKPLGALNWLDSLCLGIRDLTWYHLPPKQPPIGSQYDTTLHRGQNKKPLRNPVVCAVRESTFCGDASSLLHARARPDCVSLTTLKLTRHHAVVGRLLNRSADTLM